MERCFPSVVVINKNRSINPKLFYRVAFAKKKNTSDEVLFTMKFKTNNCKSEEEERQRCYLVNDK